VQNFIKLSEAVYELSWKQRNTGKKNLATTLKTILRAVNMATGMSLSKICGSDGRQDMGLILGAL